jgi:hypothetical protein
LGAVILGDSRKVAVIAPGDINNPDEHKSDKHVIVYHPGYRKEIDPVEFPGFEKIRMKPALAANPHPELSQPKAAALVDDNYVDPVASAAPEFAGRWIAGFAPVGNTGLFVVVRQRFEDAMSLESSTLWNLALWSALASVVAIASLLMVLWQWARSRRREAGIGKDS